MTVFVDMFYRADDPQVQSLAGLWDLFKSPTTDRYNCVQVPFRIVLNV